MFPIAICFLAIRKPDIIWTYLGIEISRYYNEVMKRDLLNSGTQCCEEVLDI